MGLRSARIKSGKRIREVADFMGVSPSCVYSWESGTFAPRADKLLELAAYLGCSVDELLEKEDRQ